VLVCDDQILIRTGLVTVIGAQPDLDVVGECGDGRTAFDLAGRHPGHRQLVAPSAPLTITSVGLGPSPGAAKNQPGIVVSP
jgi:DNA-binding NarL/FixJ family response regulator